MLPGMGIVRYAGWGALAGAAGTTALNAVTYLDMAVRGRPASSTPEQTAQMVLERAGVAVPGDEETRRNRLSGLGPLFGSATGVGVGVLFGLLRGAGLRLPLRAGALVIGATAMAYSDGSMTALGVTDPRKWDAAAWASDVVPHLAYGAVVAAGLDALDRRC
jgi:hypothetical protein